MAIKTCSVESMKVNPKFKEFIQNEINILSNKEINKNVNIITFIELLTTENNYYFIYEYCNGGNMEQHIYKNGKMNDY